MESQQEKIPAGLRFGSGYPRPVGPEVKIHAVPGVVATKAELDEELNRRREFGAVLNNP